MKNYKRIGIIGGVSPQSSALFYKTLIEKHYKKYKDHYYPEIVMFSVDFGKIKDLQKEDDPVNYIQEFVNAIDNLERAGADFAVIASNTPHRVFSQIEKRVSIPLLSIVEIIAEYSLDQNFRNLLLLGTKFTMSEEFYRNGLKSKGIEIVVPTDDDQIIINNIIFDELVLNQIIQSSKEKLVGIIEKYLTEGVILGCTELPLIIHQEDIEKPIINTTEIFAEATLQFALN